MKNTTRYSLLALLFFTFIILAPALILYVSGTRFSFSDRDTSSTGIFDAKSNPGDATLTIDGKEHSKTPAIARFLNQGEYEFALHKDGYYDWSKRLPIEAGNVTFAQSGVEQIQLLKKTQPVVIEPTGVSNFQVINDVLWYPLGNDIVRAPANNPQDKTVIRNVATAPMTLTALRDSKYLRISGMEEVAIVNTQTNAVYQFPYASAHLEMVTDNIVVYTQGPHLYAYNLTTKAVTGLRNDIVAFTLLGNTAYLLNTKGIISSAVWNGSSFVDEQIIFNDAPVTPDESELIITNRKELFLKNGKTALYRVGQERLEQIASPVESVHLEAATNELTFVSAGELSFYNFLNSRPQLLTRSTASVNTFIIHSNIGYGFVGSSGGLEAVEIDSRDQQNRYKLLNSGQPVWQVAMTNNQKIVIALYGSSLVVLEVRN